MTKYNGIGLSGLHAYAFCKIQNSAGVNKVYYYLIIVDIMLFCFRETYALSRRKVTVWRSLVWSVRVRLISYYGVPFHMNRTARIWSKQL